MKKHIFRVAMGLLALAAFSFTLTSCGDDDKDKDKRPSPPTQANQITVAGTTTPLGYVGAEYGSEYDGYTIYLFENDDEESAVLAWIDIAGEFLDGNTHKLTDDLRGENWYTGIGFYFDGDQYSYWTDEEDAFRSGTLLVQAVDEETILINVSGKTGTNAFGYDDAQEPFEFSIYYKGAIDYYVDDDEAKPFVFKAKAKKAARRNK